jgi:hypothetical protein
VATLVDWDRRKDDGLDGCRCGGHGGGGRRRSCGGHIEIL